MSATTHYNVDDPYGKLLAQFFVNEFPQLNTGSNQATLDYLSQAFFATSNVRYGPLPPAESQVQIRTVISNAMAEGKPIPILTPFGSRKLRLGEPLDVAEVSALKTLACLQARVKERYLPGVRINLRLEDTSGHYLFADEGEPSRDATSIYVARFQKLVRILGFEGFIHPILESQLFDEQEYTALADEMVKPLMQYLEDTDLYGFDNYWKHLSWKALDHLGWKGMIPQEQRDYYRNRYKVLYPGISDYDASMKLARYLAGSWARIQLKGTGADPLWDRYYLRVTFVPPVPGSPAALTGTNIYYRVLPRKFADTHIAPWRAKGYLAIEEDGTVTPKLASWGEQHDYVRSSISLFNGADSVDVQTDYELR